MRHRKGIDHRAFLDFETRLRSANGAPLLLLMLPPLVVYWFFASPLRLLTPMAPLRTAADCRVVGRGRPGRQEGAEAEAEVETETEDDVDPARTSLAGSPAGPNLNPLLSPWATPGSPRMVLSPSAPSSRSVPGTGFDGVEAQISIWLS